jgi:putative phosphoribosyl transferase
MFGNRRDAGRRLARRLAHLKGEMPVVIALPRGGVPVAFEIALALDAPLDLALVQKIGAPGQPELAIGAVVDGETEHLILNREIAEACGAGEDYIREETRRKLAEIEDRRRRYFGGLERPPLRGRTVIVVDDGIATGASLRAALEGLRRAEVGRRVVAVPVGPEGTVAELRREVDEVVCLETPAWFAAVGQAYDDFSQTSDEELIRLLRQAAGRRAGSGG